MKIFVDENIPRMTVQALHDAGHDVKGIRGTACEGIEDEEIWTMVTQGKRILLTTDSEAFMLQVKSFLSLCILLFVTVFSTFPATRRVVVIDAFDPAIEG